MYTYEVSTDGITWRVFSEMHEIDLSLKQLSEGHAEILIVKTTPSISGVSTVQADGVKLSK